MNGAIRRYVSVYDGEAILDCETGLMHNRQYSAKDALLVVWWLNGKDRPLPAYNSKD